MIKSDPKQLAIDLLDRSICLVKVSAVIFDNHGIFAWGWNSMGVTGFGTHAEVHAIERANKKRLKGASIAVAGKGYKSQRIISSRPCDKCRDRIMKVGINRIFIQNKAGIWVRTITMLAMVYIPVQATLLPSLL